MEGLREVHLGVHLFEVQIPDVFEDHPGVTDELHLLQRGIYVPSLDEHIGVSAGQDIEAALCSPGPRSFLLDSPTRRALCTSVHGRGAAPVYFGSARQYRRRLQVPAQLHAVP